MTGPSAFLFDMDGLLLDTERVARDCFVQVAMQHGIPRHRAEPFFLTLIGTSVADGTAMTRDFLPSHIPVDLVETQWNSLYEARIAQEVPLRPTVARTLQRLASQGTRMAVVTSTRGDRARRKLATAGIVSHFEFVLGGDEVSANKPDPAPYLEAANRMGVAAHLCAAFEDSDRGIASAVAAGCRAVQVPDLRSEHTPLPGLGQHLATSLSDGVAHVLTPNAPPHG
jgi:HAD superfamily hydrolase (TIGR01509 family)